jgi:CHRD domain
MHPQTELAHEVTLRRRTRAASAAVLLGVGALVACAGEAPTEMTVELPMFAASQTGAGHPYDLELSQELSTTVTGDPDGVGTVRLTLNAGQQFVCWSTEATNIALPATASHIHKAPFGVSGPIVLPLSPPDANGQASGCREGVDRDLIVDIFSNPDDYYVNVHTTQFPAGAIRSQIR